MNIDEFLAPISAENPCGENLEYDADFQAMGQASQGKAEQQFGDTIIPAEPADWNTVEKHATSLLGRTKDLRVMLALTHAWTRRRGLPGYADGLLLVQEALSRYWERLYPLLEEYGETDPFYRINALAGLSDKSELTIAVRNASLLRSNGDEISLRDAQALLELLASPRSFCLPRSLDYFQRAISCIWVGLRTAMDCPFARYLREYRKR